jgi:hypothetical protein
MRSIGQCKFNKSYALFFVVLGFVLLPSVALGCTCYDAAGGDFPVDPEPFCFEQCEDYAYTTALSDTGCSFGDTDCEFTNGYCDCGLATISFSCSEVCLFNNSYATAPAPSATTTPSSNTRPLITPKLSIDIPTVKFTSTIVDGETRVNYLGDYIAGIYKYLIGVATLIAIVMLMIGGLQYSLFQGSGAKTRMKNAVTGLILLLSTYIILATINPRLVILEMPELDVPKYVFLSSENTDADVTPLNLPAPTGTQTNGVPYFNQRAYSTNTYGALCDGNQTIKSSGCGPTSAAMVLSYYNVNTDPIKVAENFEKEGFRICGTGTAYEAFTSASIITSNNMKGTVIPPNDRTVILDHLNNDRPIIVSVGKSKFTSKGHFIVLTGVNQDGSISLNDPNSGYISVTQNELWPILNFAVQIGPK